MVNYEPWNKSMFTACPRMRYVVVCFFPSLYAVRYGNGVGHISIYILVTSPAWIPLSEKHFKPSLQPC